MIDDAQLITRLMAAGLATQDVVEQGRQLAERENTTLYHSLIFHQLVREQDVVQIASDVLNVPAVDLASASLDAEMAALLPKEIASSSQTLPLGFIDDDTGEARVLRLAMVDPIDVMAMDEVASHTGVNIRPVLVGPLDLQNALAKLYVTKPAKPEPVLMEMPTGASAEDSWAALFDDPDKEQAVENLEDSAVISLEMRDRPPTDVFEVVDEDLFYGNDNAYGNTSLSDLVESVDGTQIGSPIDLDQWDLDDAFSDSEDVEDSEEELDSDDFSEEQLSGPFFAPVDDEDEDFETTNGETRLGLGSRIAELDFGHLSFDDDEEEDQQDIQELEESQDDEQQPSSEPNDEESLEHSIEVALEIKTVAVDVDSIDLDQLARSESSDDGEESSDGQQKRGSSEAAKSAIETLTREVALEDDEPDEELKAVSKKSKASASTLSLREKLNKATAKKKEENESSALGRIHVKQIAVPAFKGVVEKRSDKKKLSLKERKEQEPTTREMSADDLMGLAVGSKDAGEVDAVAQLMEEFDPSLLLRTLLTLVLEKELVDVDELVQRARQFGEDS